MCLYVDCMFVHRFPQPYNQHSWRVETASILSVTVSNAGDEMVVVTMHPRRSVVVGSRCMSMSLNACPVSTTLSRSVSAAASVIAAGSKVPLKI